MRCVVLMLASLALGAAASGAAAAEAPSGAPQWSAGCIQDLLLDRRLEGLSLAQVTGAGPVHFQAGEPGRAGAAARPTKAYVVKGDLVVAGPTRGAWTCVLFPNARGGTQGWVPSDRLAAAPASAAAPRLADWAGDWARDPDASVTLTMKGPQLAVHGAAVWRGRNPDDVRDGELSGDARPQGDTLQILAEDCHPVLRLLGRYLVVGDDGQCGAPNVNFSGVYRRKATRPAG